MRRWITSCLLLGILHAGFVEMAAGAEPSFRAVWADAFHEGYKSTGQIDNLVARAAAGRYNAIVAEVLAYHDRTGNGHGAYWNSAIVPKAADISGGIDPLAVLCTKAHAAGIEVHAWIVTYRSCSVWPPSGNSIVAAHPEWIMVPSGSIGGGVAKVDGVYQFDPGSPDVQEYLASIVRELVTNYPIDGINWDYIRYTQADAGYPANTSYANSGLERYKRIYNTSTVPPPTGSGSGNWSDFRRRTIDEHIRRCRAEIAAIKTNPRQPLRHSADLITWGNAPADFTSSSSYNLFQNWKLWMEKGYLDAGMPMTYYREHCATHAPWYRNWVNACLNWRGQRHMFIGQATYLNTFANSVTQMNYALSRGAQGLITYSYNGTRMNDALDCSSTAWAVDWTWYNHVATNLFTQPAGTPPMPWRDPATAVEGTLWGRITNLAGAPVDDATVLIGGQSIRTDGNGYYVATMLAATAEGTAYSLAVSKSGLPAGGHPAVRVYAGDVARYDFQLGAAPAQIVLNAPPLDREVEPGGTLADDTFTVSNIGSAALIYAVSDNVSWLSVSPVYGVNRGQPDTIVITYETSGLTPGRYTAQISVTDPAASNSPRTLAVNLAVTMPGVPGDFDADRDVDMEDFGRFQACLNGSGIAHASGCERANLDLDSDVDAIDRAKFLNCFTGPNQPGDENCAG